MALTEIYSGDYLAAIESLEERLRDHFTVADVAEPVLEGEVGEAHAYFPYNFAGRFPIAGVSEVGHEGERYERGTTPLPATFDVGVRIYHPSLTPTGAIQAAFEDGRQTARRVTRAVYAAWRESLYADEELWGLCRHVTLGRAEFGDHDRVGNPFMSPRDDTILWVHAVTVRFTL